VLERWSLELDSLGVGLPEPDRGPGRKASRRQGWGMGGRPPRREQTGVGFAESLRPS
jgi:hypothetical protein